MVSGRDWVSRAEPSGVGPTALSINRFDQGILTLPRVGRRPIGILGPKFPMSSQTLPAKDGDSPGIPSQGVRTLITLLLFFHLFALLAGVAGNFGARSGLRRQLRESPGIQPYLRTLWMDTGYDFGLIYNNPYDFDHRCQIELNPATGGNEQAERTFVDLMPKGIWDGMRQRRYLALAQKLRLHLGDNNEEADLVAALAGGMLRKANVENGTHLFRCLIQQTQDLVSLEEIAPEMRDPEHEEWFATFYEADLILDQNRWSPSKREDRGSMTQSRGNLQRSR